LIAAQPTEPRGSNCLARDDFRMQKLLKVSGSGDDHASMSAAIETGQCVPAGSCTWRSTLRALVRSRLNLWALGVVLLVSVVGLNRPFNSDEVWTLHTVSQPWASMMDELRADIHPPAYYFLLKSWIAVGTSEIAVRGLSVLLYVATGVVLLFAVPWATGAPAGRCCALVFLTSPLAIQLAQYGRMYALLGLAAAVSTVAYSRIVLQRDTSARTAALYVAFNVIGTLTHIWFFFLLGAQVLLGFAKLRRIVLLAAASSVPYALLWGPTLIRQVGKTSEALAWLRTPQPSEFPGALFFIAPVLCLTLPLAIRAMWTSRSVRIAAPPAMLIAVSLVTLLVPFLLSWWKPVFTTRFTVVALPPLALGVSLVVTGAIRRQLESVLLAGAVIFSLGTAIFRNVECDPRWTAQYLAGKTQDGDTVIFTNLSRLPVDYYWDRLEPNRKITELSFPASIDAHPGFEGVVETDAMVAPLKKEAAALAERLRGKPGTVFLLHHARPRPDGILTAVLDRSLPRSPEMCRQCSGSPNYVDTVTAWSRSADAQQEIAGTPAVPVTPAAGRRLQQPAN
jgi:hypothetical protein